MMKFSNLIILGFQAVFSGFLGQLFDLFTYCREAFLVCILQIYKHKVNLEPTIGTKTINIFEKLERGPHAP